MKSKLLSDNKVGWKQSTQKCNKCLKVYESQMQEQSNIKNSSCLLIQSNQNRNITTTTKKYQHFLAILQ